MEEKMIDVSVTAPSQATTAVAPQEYTSLQKAILQSVDEAVAQSKAERLNLDGNRLDALIEMMQLEGLEDTGAYWKAILENLYKQCGVRSHECRGEGEERTIAVKLDELVYDSLEDFEQSDAYQQFLGKKEKDPERFEKIDRDLVQPIRAYYEALDNDMENDVVVLYEKAYDAQAQGLVDALEYPLKSFCIDKIDADSDPELLGALHRAVLLVIFDGTGENPKLASEVIRFHVSGSRKNKRDSDSGKDKRVLLVTEQCSLEKDDPFVSLAEDDWKEQILVKASLLIAGALPKSELLKALHEREELIERLTKDMSISQEDHHMLCEALQAQIDALEDYAILYGDATPCSYGVEELEEIGQRFQLQARYTQSNKDRWLGKLKHDGERIRKIQADESPKYFYERYVQLCRLIDAQQEHRDKLLDFLPLDELREKVKGVVIDRLELHAIRRDYREKLKEVYLTNLTNVFRDKPFALSFLTRSCSAEPKSSMLFCCT